MPPPVYNVHRLVTSPIHLASILLTFSSYSRPYTRSSVYAPATCILAHSHVTSQIQGNDVEPKNVAATRRCSRVGAFGGSPPLFSSKVTTFPPRLEKIAGVFSVISSSVLQHVSFCTTASPFHRAGWATNMARKRLVMTQRLFVYQSHPTSWRVHSESTLAWTKHVAVVFSQRKLKLWTPEVPECDYLRCDTTTPRHVRSEKQHHCTPDDIIAIESADFAIATAQGNLRCNPAFKIVRCKWLRETCNTLNKLPYPPRPFPLKPPQAGLSKGTTGAGVKIGRWSPFKRFVAPCL